MSRVRTQPVRTIERRPALGLALVACLIVLPLAPSAHSAAVACGATSCAAMFASSASVSTIDPFAPSGDLPAQLAQAKSLLDASQGLEALAKAKEGLELAPDNLELLDVASRAAALAGQNDQALWYASLALDQAGASKDKIVGEIQKRLADLDPLQQKNQAVLGAYAQTLLQLGQRCASKKFYATAVDLLTRCRNTPLAQEADIELAKIYDDKKAVEALLESGLDVPVKAKKKRNPAAIAKEDAKHATWETHFEVKGKSYTVMTDMGTELAEQMSSAMEQINRFYRTVFHVKEQGGTTARVTIKVFKSRAEFDKYSQEKGDPPQAKGVKGFFSSSALKVCTYDTREDGFPPSFLWSTLFHEASHQFTAMMAPSGAVPTWLNEGTASYFEGARLRSNGTVETNLVPPTRLSELKIHLTEGTPTLKDVVSFYQPGSYPGEYYPFGWALVYFLQNYEDENSVRVYKPLYHDYMVAYKSGAKHDVVGRFVEYFVTKAKQPGVATFEDFEKRWKDWMLKLDEIVFGPPDKADLLIARARKERADKQPESAIESYRWAIRKRPGDAVAYFELGELMADMKQDDAALFNDQRALHLARALGDPVQAAGSATTMKASELIDQAKERIGKIDKALGDGVSSADATLTTSAVDAAKKYSEAKCPLVALRLLDQAQAAMGAASELRSLRVEIASSSGAETRRWRRIPTSGDLAEWQAGEHWKVQGESIAAEAGPHMLRACFLRDDPPERYSFEVKVDASRLEDQSMLGVCFGAGGHGLQIVGLFRDGDVEAMELKDGLTPLKLLGHVEKEHVDAVTLTIDVSKDKVEYSINGKSVGKRDFDPENLEGQVGLVIFNGNGTFSDAKMRY